MEASIDQQIVFESNVAGRVRNTKLATTKPLWPLFEAISNSVHSIQEKNDGNGRIEVRLIRNGKPETLAELDSVDRYPIKGMQIVDNGIGFTDKNFKSFLTADSDYKIEKGAKGIGRFVCLKAFHTVRVDSIYNKGKQKYHRTFDFKEENPGIFDYSDKPYSGKVTGTRVSILDFRQEFQNKCPLTCQEISEKIIEHFLVYFLMDAMPEVKIVEQNQQFVVVNKIYAKDIKPTIQTDGFELKGQHFNLSLVKIFHGRTNHQIHYCANERDVKTEPLGNLILDLGKRIIQPDTEFAYHAYITGQYLDDNVDSERTGFVHPEGIDDDEQLSNEITQKEIERGSVKCIEKILGEYLDTVRDRKMSEVQEYVYAEAPQFRSVLTHRPEKINSIPPSFTGQKLNMELYRIQQEWESEVREQGEKLLKISDDATDVDDYKRSYAEYLEELNDVGKANLAKYIVHRKSIIELLDKYLDETEEGRFKKEDAIHNLFFPIKKYSDEINYDKQNLWLIDERLSYHSYLSSDKSFKQLERLDSESVDRTDLLIFNEAFAFAEGDDFSSFTLVEFKRPGRDDYNLGSEKGNPVDQIYNYIRTIRNSKATSRTGRLISVNSENIPFYCYIICDFNSKLFEIMETREFKKTPDGQGFFRFHDSFNAYIEVISYTKLLKDAKQRNRVLFEKLNLPRS